jgi:uracil-DNA glycosylase family 4
MPELDPQLQAQLAARLAYYRDLGVYDFYRRPGQGSELTASARAGESEAASTSQLPGAVAPAAQDDDYGVNSSPSLSPSPSYQDEELSEESDISPRKPALIAPPQGARIAPAEHAAALRVIREDIGDCTRCALSRGRNKIVFADGDPNARLMFVGEGPGADEDAQGLPFVGRAGQLLNNMIQAMGLRREDVYIANVVKCRPPQNRVPEPEEANTCMQFLFRQIDVVRPEVIVALGSTAATYLLGAKSPLSGLRGRIHTVRDTKLIVTYHPAFLLRDPRQKKEAWKDLQIAMSELGIKPPKRAAE